MIKCSACGIAGIHACLGPPIVTNDLMLVQRVAELEKELVLVHKDLLMRAEEDSQGYKVVDLSHSVWIQLKEALEEQG